MIVTNITGTGKYIPKNIIKNDYFLDKVFFDEKRELINKPTSEIIKKFEEITEITERRFICDHLFNSDMAAIASTNAIESSGINKEDLDYVIFAHNYGDIDIKNNRIDMMPSMAARIKHKLGIKNNRCRTYDVNFGCPGWVEGLIMGNQFIVSGLAKKVLVIGSETLSRASDAFDRSSMIFADGAGAVILEAQEQAEKAGVLSYFTICDNGEEISYLKNGGSLNKESDDYNTSITMKGRKIYEYALRKVPAAIKKTIELAGLDIEDISKVFLHQANAKMDHAMIERLFKLYNKKEVPEFFAPMTVQFLGNTSVATVPTMYDMVIRNEMEGHQLKSKDIVVFASVGGGMSINAVVYKLP